MYLYKKVKGVLQAEPLQPTFFVPMVGRAEEERTTPAEPAEPVLVNGDFQKAPDGQPAGWYYVRQGKVEASSRTPQGKCLTFINAVPGRAAQALQAVGIDGRRTREIEISLWVRAERVQLGTGPDETPGLAVVFFNSDREVISRQGIGPWSGSFGWVRKASADGGALRGPPGERGGRPVGRDRKDLGERPGTESYRRKAGNGRGSQVTSARFVGWDQRACDAGTPIIGLGGPALASSLVPPYETAIRVRRRHLHSLIVGVVRHHRISQHLLTCLPADPEYQVPRREATRAVHIPAFARGRGVSCLHLAPAQFIMIFVTFSLDLPLPVEGRGVRMCLTMMRAFRWF